MDKIDIYVATLVSFDRVGEEKFNETGTQLLSKTLEFTNIKTVDCVIDEERGNAIDLETGNIYHIIKRDNFNNILKEEVDRINDIPNGDLLVYKYYRKNMKNISLLYQMYINARAQKKYQEYLEKIKTEKDIKVKTIRRKKQI